MSLLCLVSIQNLASYGDEFDNDALQTTPESSEWSSHLVVGDFINWNPAKVSNVFLFKTKITNGYLEEFSKQDQALFNVKINTENNSDKDHVSFDIMFPRNYPYRNLNEADYAKSFIVIFSNGTEYDDFLAKKTDCFFIYSMQFKNSTEFNAGFGYPPVGLPFSGDDVPDYCLRQTLSSIAPADDLGRSVDLLPHTPLYQYEHFVNATDVQCISDFVLIFKSSDGSPACVKPETKSKLVERGWATTGS